MMLHMLAMFWRHIRYVNIVRPCPHALLLTPQSICANWLCDAKTVYRVPGSLDVINGIAAGT